MLWEFVTSVIHPLFFQGGQYGPPERFSGGAHGPPGLLAGGPRYRALALIFLCGNPCGHTHTKSKAPLSHKRVRPPSSQTLRPAHAQPKKLFARGALDCKPTFILLSGTKSFFMQARLTCITYCIFFSTCRKKTGFLAPFY